MHKPPTVFSLSTIFLLFMVLFKTLDCMLPPFISVENKEGKRNKKEESTLLYTSAFCNCEAISPTNLQLGKSHQIVFLTNLEPTQIVVQKLLHLLFRVACNTQFFVQYCTQFFDLNRLANHGNFRSVQSVHSDKNLARWFSSFSYKRKIDQIRPGMQKAYTSLQELEILKVIMAVGNSANTVQTLVLKSRFKAKMKKGKSKN
ncbi:hypothetical protein L2E82_48793 [Cichorium intybus]|uniref:Uncharacterized protein n=1 Tax=Cichorium intybus TaxID=13427 RepID=A0ACB8YY21_CICIN|nr:hypothetical protein L2E82_48793 [Cichorium intybus]